MESKYYRKFTLGSSSYNNKILNDFSNNNNTNYNNDWETSDESENNLIYN